MLSGEKRFDMSPWICMYMGCKLFLSLEFEKETIIGTEQKLGYSTDQQAGSSGE